MIQSRAMHACQQSGGFKRTRTVASDISISSLERIFTSWLEEYVDRGNKRDMDALLQQAKEYLHWKITVPCVSVLMDTASIAERVALQAPNMLIRPAIVQAAIMAVNAREACVHVPDAHMWSRIDKLSGTIRCVLTRGENLLCIQLAWIQF